MIVLFTDFGLGGPYTGQIKAVLQTAAPGTPVIDLFADAPCFAPQAAAYLLAAYSQGFSPGTVFLCVVDPGVGGARAALAVEADGHWFVGPDNGLLSVVAARAETVTVFRVDWRPQTMSASFHGRDLFAPLAAGLARGEGLPAAARISLAECAGADWPAELDQVVYVDHFGNAMTGRRAATVPRGGGFVAANQQLPFARTFSDVPEGAAFWYANANGLAELAVHCGRADRLLGLTVGSELETWTPMVER